MSLQNVLFGILAIGAAFVVSGCGRLYFFPDGQLRVLPSQIGLDYEDVFIDSGDERLHGWFLPAGGEATRGPAVLFLHGNAENISSHIGNVHWLPPQGFHVLLFDYRGYGNSTGHPNLEGVGVDAEAALRALRARPEVDPDAIVVFGQSLGGSIALTAVERLQDEIPIRALVIDSAFSSYRQIARDKLAEVWLTWPLQWPLSFLFPDSPDPAASLSRLRVPSVLLVQGEADRVVPIEHGRRLYAVAPEGTLFWSVPGARHIGVFAEEQWRRRLVEHLEEALEAQPPARRQGISAESPAARRRSTSSPPIDATTS